jgi:hypothetical protein
MDIFVPILKVDAATREVHGVMAEEARDKSGETFDYESSKPYVQAWSQAMEKDTNGRSVGNVRGQHGKIAAGKLVSITFDDATKTIPVVAKIVDNNEWEKVQEGVYNGFSIGGSYIKKWADGNTIRYTAKPSEVSIVDNPCMYGAKFTMVKADGAFEYRGFAGTQPAPSSDLAALRVQVRAQFDELHKQIIALQERRAVASRQTKFQPGGVEKSDAASQELEKALSNGKPVAFQASERSSPRFQTVESVGSGQRIRSGRPFDTNGAEKSETADAELHKALANGEPVGPTRRGN